mmetsp:Transcript_23954/g.52377  ORF Transcript_23954/g.52377 Transcript_23954/m.52377 type:complete len:396 (-) Transcript_23954:52-1239(-)|eukprot:CAMPEP_0168178094 /NCGR_PEP_ID=MMETSP0139_2-20121125/8888_1 /TAXON_ID=44445 /ORGANISM="Pseudo-nitzschia australis, Strain 10249 10 AB" /LENGTH=395 /DNA_ID=CAMNT_0008097357 /DNA_START=34 /DNA_END=1221 /DNA_ORIENTATION=-
MDILQRELKRKKEALLKAKQRATASSETQNGGDGRKKRKYLKVSDLRRIEEEEQEEKERKRWALHHKKKNSVSSSVSSAATVKETDRDEKTDEARSKFKNKKKGKSSINSPAVSSPPATARDDSDSTPACITQKLRQIGLVVRYFGEGNTARLERLKKALEQQSKTLEGLSELEEFRLGKGHGIRNQFLEKNKELKKDQQQLSAIGIGDKRSLERKEPGKEKNTTKSDLERENEDDQSDPPKFIYKYLKGLLKEWERELEERSESIARSVAGRTESKTLKQCKDYIRPLFKLLKSRRLEEELQFHFLKIVNFAKQGEFVKAHDSYMDVAIGRAAWPIGVTMVGIHARSGRAKIESANVAHVMNSELQRKYLTSVKRLLTFDQKRRTDVDPSKKVR